MMLIRNSLEMFSTAFDMGINEDRYTEYITNPGKFDSKKSIAVAKKTFPIIGPWYGLFSDFVHIKGVHALPHHPQKELVIGGVFDTEEQRCIKLRIYMLLGAVDILNGLLELSYIKFSSVPRYWKRINEEQAEFLPNLERRKRILQVVGQQIENFK